MAKKEDHRTSEVTQFLDELNHPFRKEIEELRIILLAADSDLTENIKWNGPNYCYKGEDRITIKIQPPKVVQLIFHRGAKVLEQPKNKLIDDNSKLLIWKGNDRAVATFKSMEDISSHKKDLIQIVKNWLEATSNS